MNSIGILLDHIATHCWWEHVLLVILLEYHLFVQLCLCGLIHLLLLLRIRLISLNVYILYDLGLSSIWSGILDIWSLLDVIASNASSEHDYLTVCHYLVGSLISWHEIDYTVQSRWRFRGLVGIIIIIVWLLLLLYYLKLPFHWLILFLLQNNLLNFIRWECRWLL